MHTLRILDIDLDFFLNYRATNKGNYGLDRIPEGYYVPWSVKEVTAFLEGNCGLAKKQSISGKYFIFHDEIFYFLRNMQEENDFRLLFMIDHIDAHSDFGTFDLAYKYIAEDILHKPLLERAYPLTDVPGKLTAANFLQFMIACRWLKDVKYITNLNWVCDLPWWIYKNWNISSNIQLKKFTKEQMTNIITNYVGRMDQGVKDYPPLELEPEVPFRRIHFTDFQSDGQYDLIFLTQSPSYTPKSSDLLIPLIKSYFRP